MIQNIQASPIDEIDRRIIEATAKGLPLCTEPYREIADQLGIESAEVMSRMQHMTDTGVIRRIGLVPNHYKLGYSANGMTVWDVDDSAVEAAGHQIGMLDFVSHCYRRPRRAPVWPYNFFAMVHGKSRDEVVEKTATIEKLLGGDIRSHEILYSTRILKKTGFRPINPKAA